MADVFISYSKKDADKVRLLSAYLEANGYTVWWDTDLENADDFSEQILKQIELARTVIVLWTENSVKSTFVYAEAQAAHHSEKLVLVRAGSVGYDRIRPPFNALHTHEFDDFAKILAAVENRIAAPKPSVYVLKKIRYQMLLWFGVFGGAITFFTGLQSIFKLANWASWLSLFWVDLCGSVWVQAFKLFAISFPKHVAVPATTMLFVWSTVVGSGLARSHYAASNRNLRATAFPLAIIAEFVVLAGVGVGVFICSTSVYGLQVLHAVGIPWIFFDLYVYFLMLTLSIIISVIWHRAWKPQELLIITVSYFMLVFFIAVMWTQLSSKLGVFQNNRPEYVALWFALVFSYALIPFIAPVRGLFKRVAAIYLFVILLISLNSLSQLGFDVSTPPVRNAYASDREPAEPDPSARKWYTMAASWGDPVAMRFMGELHDKGQGVPQDYVIARKWFERAADKGDALAMRRLGGLYANGQGVPKDEAKAREWYKLADDQRTSGLLDVVAVWVAVAAPDYVETLGLPGTTNAKYLLGLLYYDEQGFARDLAKAHKWYGQAAIEGHSNAMIYLGVLYQNGQGVDQDYTKAREWYEKAVAKGNALAMSNLGALYQNGQGVDQDYDKAREWYEKAAAAGNARAMGNLGRLYENGMGVAQDYVKAREWYEKAVAKGYEQTKSNLERLAIRMAAAARRYVDALRLQEALTAKMEAAETTRHGKPAKETAEGLGNLSWYALLAHEPAKALAAAERGHELFPDDRVLETNRAHALMLLGRAAEANALYLAHKGKPVEGAGNKPWEQLIVEDFEALREAGVTHPMMVEVQAALIVEPR